MKKLLFIIAGVLTLTLFGCRQQDDVLSPEETENLQLLKKSRATSDSAVVSSFGPEAALSGDPAPPPIK